jgi:hypothetical protein
LAPIARIQEIYAVCEREANSRQLIVEGLPG